MNAKTMPFQPAPRPQPRVSPEQTRELAEATRDLGFGRTTSVPETDAPADAPAPVPAPTAAAPIAQRQSGKAAEQAAPAAEPDVERMTSMRVVVPDETWIALRQQALNRRVTVKYLILEALAAKGYDVDLSRIAEDGRRSR